MDTLTAIVPNWLTARRTLGAIQNIHSYYPNMKIYIVDDVVQEKDFKQWQQIYRAPHYRPDVIFDPDSSKLHNLPNTEYIQVPFHKWLGDALDYAMDKINSKWILYMDGDVRILQPKLIEYFLEETDDKCCGVGIDKQRHPDYPNLAKGLLMVRGDLYHKHKCTFKENWEIKPPLEIMTMYFKKLTDLGYNMKYFNNIYHDYVLHLRYDPKQPDIWEKHY